MLQVRWYFSTETQEASYKHLLESVLGEIADYTATGGTLYPCTGFFPYQDKTVLESSHVLEIVFKDGEYNNLIGSTIAQLLKTAFKQWTVLYSLSPITCYQVGNCAGVDIAPKQEEEHE